MDVVTRKSTDELRAELANSLGNFWRFRGVAKFALLRARHDSGAVSPAIYQIIRTIETDISWVEHRQVQS